MHTQRSVASTDVEYQLRNLTKQTFSLDDSHGIDLFVPKLSFVLNQHVRNPVPVWRC